MKKKNKVTKAMVQHKLDEMWDAFKYKALTASTVSAMNQTLSSSYMGTTEDAYFFFDGKRSRRIHYFEFYKSAKTGALDLDIVLDKSTLMH